MSDAGAFIALIEACERVNITTAKENSDVKAASGDYEAACINLVEWKDITAPDREFLWQRWLRNKVANARAYAPGASL